MRELMSLFLSFARLSNETTSPEPDSAAGILKTVADTWEPFAAEKGLSLVLRREAECPGAYSPVMLGTVANNLVKNAVAYTESGVVTITETSEGFIVSDSGPRRRRGRPHLRARRARQCSRRRRLGRRTRPFDRLAHLPPLGLDGNGGQGP